MSKLKIVKYRSLNDLERLLSENNPIIYSYVPNFWTPNKVVVNLYEINNTGYLFSVEMTFNDLRMLKKIYKNLYSCNDVSDFFPF